MSTMEDKLGNEQQSRGRARCWLKKHLLHRWGYRVISEDLDGPVLVEVDKMEGSSRWRRVVAEDGDFLMEETDGGEQQIQENAGPKVEESWAWSRSTGPRERPKRRSRKS